MKQEKTKLLKNLKKKQNMDGVCSSSNCSCTCYIKASTLKGDKEKSKWY